MVQDFHVVARKFRRGLGPRKQKVATTMTSYNRKEVNYTDIYHNYYSDISLGAGVGADTLSEQQVHRYSVDTPRYSVDAPLYTPASVYSPPLESSNRLVFYLGFNASHPFLISLL